MPTVNNYSFSNVTYVIEEGANVATAVGASYATLTISPTSGYEITAGDFSIDPSFSNSYVDSVTFAQDGNNVICTINFTAGVTMPSSNVNIPLCVIGQGVIKEITISGKVSAAVGSNVTGDASETDTPYSNSGAIGTNELLFSRTYTASTGYYWSTSSFPNVQITTGNQSNYNITQTPTYNLDNQLTSVSFDVNYTYPSNSISGDVINITVPSTKEIYVPTEYVTSYGKFPINIGKGAQTHELLISGGEGATFSVTIDDGTTVTPIVTSVDIPENGLYPIDIDFPAFTGSTSPIKYEITISGDVDPSFAQVNPIIVNQYGILPRVSFTATSAAGITGYSTVSVDFEPQTSLKDPVVAVLDWTLSYAGTSLTFDGIPVNEDFSGYAPVTVECAPTPSFNPYINVVSSAGVNIGDKFNLVYPEGAEGYSPFTYEVVSVPGSAIFVTPNITVQTGQLIDMYRNEGNVINIKSAKSTEISATSINLIIEVEISRFGSEDATFTLDLDNFLSVT